MYLSTSFYVVLGAELMSSCLLSKHFAHGVVSPAPKWLLMKLASVLSVLSSAKHLMSTYILSLLPSSVLDHEFFNFVNGTLIAAAKSPSDSFIASDVR